MPGRLVVTKEGKVFRRKQNAVTVFPTQGGTRFSYFKQNGFGISAGPFVVRGQQKCIFGVKITNKFDQKCQI